MSSQTKREAMNSCSGHLKSACACHHTWTISHTVLANIGHSTWYNTCARQNKYMCKKCWLLTFTRIHLQMKKNRHIFLSGMFEESTFLSVSPSLHITYSTTYYSKSSSFSLSLSLLSLFASLSLLFLFLFPQSEQQKCGSVSPSLLFLSFRVNMSKHLFVIVHHCPSLSVNIKLFSLLFWSSTHHFLIFH